MVETIQKESRCNTVNPERKYIRLQVVGMSFWLSIPVAMMLAIMFGLDSITGQISALLFVVGCVFFSFGLVGRQELAEKRRMEHQDPPDCPKS